MKNHPRNHDLERIKRSTDLATVAQACGVKLARQGADLVGLCPFHEEATPSFHITPSKNIFHCFGCGAGGSVIDFVMKKDGITFRQAVELLLAQTGVVRQAAAASSGEAGAVEAAAVAKSGLAPERARQLLERVVAIYEQTFAAVADGRRYLESRGITDTGLFTTYRLGYSHGRLAELLPKDGRLKEELRSLGIFLDGGQERFTGCVVFPVFDVEGRLVTLYGRYTGGGEKRHLYLPGRPKGLWNAAAMKTHAEIVLVESVIDALSVMMAGTRNAVSIQGTDGLTDVGIETFRLHGVQSVVLLMDGDAPGRKAAQALAQRLSAFRCRVLRLPEGEDPNSFLRKQGAEKFAVWLAAEPPAKAAASVLSEPPLASAAGGFTVVYGVRRYRVMGLEQGPRRLKATVRVEHAGKLHVDTVDFYSARSRSLLCQDLCRLFSETPETIEADLSRLIVECEKVRPSDSRMPAAVSVAPAMGAAERAEAEAFGRRPDLIEAILADFEACGLVGETSNKLLGYVAMTSRKRDAPLSVLILSSSGAGKTALQDAVAAFCPSEDLVKLTSLSGKALFYKEQMSLKHKALVLEEGDGAQEATYAIRNLISARELVIESTIKDLSTGRLVTMENRVEGPTAVFLTTTNPEIDAETRSRFFVTSVDESREQTRAILAFQRRLHRSDGLADRSAVEAILRKHRNFQRLLKPLAVKNPYAEQLTYGDDRLQGRRDQPKYLNLIKAVAFLRQMLKEVRFETRHGCAVPFIEVDLADIGIANRLAHEILGHSLDELSRPARDLLLLIEQMAGQRLKKNGGIPPRLTDFFFSRRDVREFAGWSNTRLHIHLKELVDFEYLLVEAGRNGLPYRYRLAYEGQGKQGERFLLGLKEVQDLKPPPS